MDSFTLRPLDPYRLNRKLDGPQRESRQRGEEENLYSARNRSQTFQLVTNIYTALVLSASISIIFVSKFSAYKVITVLVQC
jgi:hypothetical protein